MVCYCQPRNFGVLPSLRLKKGLHLVRCIRLHPVWVVAVWLVVWTGCASSPDRIWRPAEFVSPRILDGVRSRSKGSVGEEVANHLQRVHDPEAAYAHAVSLESENAEGCVDWYYRTAELLWPVVAESPVVDDASAESDRVLQLYHSAVGKMVTTGARFDRLDSRWGIQIHPVDAGASFRAPVQFHGYAWTADELRRLEVVGDYESPVVKTPRRGAGVGVPLLLHPESKRPFVYPNAVTTGTAILRPSSGAVAVSHAQRVGRVDPASFPPLPDAHSSKVPMTLDVVNPATLRTVRVANRVLPLRYDLTAPVAYLNATTERSWMQGFVKPDQLDSETGLAMLEPYQRGKIPVIFVHGLASDGWTWVAMVNELFAHPDLRSRFQFWAFSYPTGGPFPGEAANLREDLLALRAEVDPEHRDPALDEIVLIGHSMGGLVSKMQISSSGDRIARSVFNKPIHDLDMSPELIQRLERMMHFEPSRQIHRVIFIGTPHRGSGLANRGVGGIASKLVRYSDEQTDEVAAFLKSHEQDLSHPLHKVPTSVDLLRPENPTLQAVASLPVNPRVIMHSIIGVGHKGRFGRETSDGVVPLSSARHPDVASELLVDAGHGLHRDPKTIAEVIRILRTHVTLVDQTVGQRFPPVLDSSRPAVTPVPAPAATGYPVQSAVSTRAPVAR